MHKMQILRNHSAQIAACYGGYAGILAAAGALGEALFYAVVGALYALAARRELGGAKPPSGPR